MKHTGDNTTDLGLRSVSDPIRILPAADVLNTIDGLTESVAATILDPWYNKGIGGTRPDYHDWLSQVIHAAAEISDHVFVWGFPEIVAHQLTRLPRGYRLVAWLTWYYKNCPSVSARRIAGRTEDSVDPSTGGARQHGMF